MDCEILRTLYVKANGGIPCHDDFGETIELGNLATENFWSLRSHFESEKLLHIKRSLIAAELPFDNCRRCAFMRPYRAFREPTRHLECIQVEPTLTCTLSCPGCSQKLQIAHRPSPFHLDLAAFERLLESVFTDDYSVGVVQYCGQGEPLNAPRFGDYVDLCRKYLPNTKQELITNGNYDFKKKIGDRRIDVIIASIDGATAASYPQYRRGGDFNKAMTFLRDACAARPRIGRVIWKYVVLATNDSDEELLRAQALADELQVDELRFIQTHSRERSERTQVPLASPRATFIPTPTHVREEAEYALSRNVMSSKRTISVAKVCVDVFKMVRRSFYCSGWAINGGAAPMRRVELTVENTHHTARMGLPRPDVQKVYDCPTDKVGFEIKGELPKDFYPKLTMSFHCHGRLFRHDFQLDAKRIVCQPVRLLPVWQVPEMSLPPRSK